MHQEPQNCGLMHSLNMKLNKKTKNDIILVAVILVIAAAGFLFVSLTRQEGNRVVVKVNGEQTQSFSLYENRTVEIVTGDDGEFLNVLVIENGTAYMSQADCPDKICQNHRAISYKGETIVCLPHKIVIEITADTPDNGLDAVA